MSSSGSSGPVWPTVAPYPPSTATIRAILLASADRYQHARFASQHLFEPRTPRRTAFACLLYDGATANDEQASERAFAHFRYCTELLLAARRSLKRRETQPGGKVAALGKTLCWRC